MDAWVGPTVLDGRWYTPLSAQLLHGSIGHFLVNIVAIVYCGVHVEKRAGRQLFLQVIIASAAVGGAFVCLASERPVVGSSILGFGLWGAQVSVGF